MRDYGIKTIEGAQLVGRAGRWDLFIAEGRITALRASNANGGGVILPLLADIHTHLDKTFTSYRMPQRAQSLFHAIEMMGADAMDWSDADLRERAEKALARAYYNGTGFIRSHLDWTGAQTPQSWHVLTELAQDWRGRVDVELASLTPLDDLVVHGEAIADTVKASGGVLGAFVYRNTGLAGKLEQVFDLAERNELRLDFHVDEGLDPEACGIDAIIAETRKRNMQGRVLCGHGCALSIRRPTDVADILSRGGEAGIGLTVLPTCNAYLQDVEPGRTPRLRGLAPLQEARAAGIEVMLGSDNVRDAFYPYGDYDLFEVFRTAVLSAHLAPDDWIDAISEAPANWTGRRMRLREGGPADFIRIAADDLDDAVSRPRAARQVWRGGHILAENQGDFS
ncbi:amidohydrolase family protein [Ruegeria marina]|uniref:Cytosine deaminase n=1 Tax=Ruegeria marina TaxID=639004 RepID=A0A1G6V082_9RHOB|nr:amidohydrolase family protein [Ruegeria marina]SDD46968.1 cytosine deaminase [Ruegeria marina]